MGFTDLVGPLPAGPVRGAGAALPHRRLPHPAPDRPGIGTGPPSSTTSSSGWARRPADRLLAARRVGGAADPAGHARRRRRRTTSRRHRPGRSPRRTAPFRVMIRNAMWRRVELAARDDLDGLTRARGGRRRPDRPAAEVVMTRSRLGRGDRGLLRRARRGAARRRRPWPDLLPGRVRTGRWRVRQTLHDPEGHHDWVVDAVVDLDASDEAGEAGPRHGESTADLDSAGSAT